MPSASFFRAITRAAGNNQIRRRAGLVIVRFTARAGARPRQEGYAALTARGKYLGWTAPGAAACGLGLAAADVGIRLGLLSACVFRVSRDRLF